MRLFNIENKLKTNVRVNIAVIQLKTNVSVGHASPTSIKKTKHCS